MDEIQILLDNGNWPDLQPATNFLHGWIWAAQIPPMQIWVNETYEILRTTNYSLTFDPFLHVTLAVASHSTPRTVRFE